MEENQSLPVTIREAGTLPLFTNYMDQIGCFEEAWEKAKNKHENISCHNLHFLKKNNQLKTILHSPHIPMFLKRHPMMARTMKMLSYGWNSLKDLRDRSGAEEDDESSGNNGATGRSAFQSLTSKIDISS